MDKLLKHHTFKNTAAALGNCSQDASCGQLLKHHIIKRLAAAVSSCSQDAREDVVHDVGASRRQSALLQRFGVALRMPERMLVMMLEQLTVAISFRAEGVPLMSRAADGVALYQSMC